LSDSPRLERAKSKALLASGLGAAGAAAGAPLGPVGAVVGGGLGVLTGVIVGDRQMTFPLDYVAIPAYEYAAVLSGRSPSHTVYIKAGETLMPTGGNVDDVELGVVEASEPAPAKRKRRKKNPWIQFNKKFQYRAKRKSETSQEYLARRTKAARAAYRKGGKK
jgi:hypothetical protein